ncbi:hypothetical protein BC938DRAFT_481085 [Jimgerdemannia flammicorona]|uniref:Uncharacterized protein n=1 Tax=Jimgerdemannia flammicorona TaxID=994334 RepID=A0A433QH01_9FUNG|nr:hypothetical protein BC938DRAFT_481085 [Jimgerdemannia flammicorona]
MVQKIGEKLQQSLQPPARDIQCGGEESDQDMAVNTVSSDAEDTEEEEEEEEEEDQDQESSAKTIQALLSIVRMLTESGKIQQVITSDNIQYATFKGTTFTEKEKMVVAMIVNFFQPFVQQHMDDNQFSEPHILTCAPLAALANIITTITGFPFLIRKVLINSQQGSHALHLTAAGIYDTFRGQWDIPVDDTNWITNSYQAGKTKTATFRAFFNTNRIESLMDSYGLHFA